MTLLDYLSVYVCLHMYVLTFLPVIVINETCGNSKRLACESKHSSDIAKKV
jgi:hypothetical protein